MSPSNLTVTARRVSAVALTLSLSLGLGASSLLAAEKVDLKRVTPVPGNQIIPIQDFIRPAFWSEVKINGEGTHIAGIGSLGGEHDQLMVIDLKSGKIDGYAGFDKGVADGVWWLGNTHVAFNMSMGGNQPLGALFVGEVNKLRDTYPVYEQLRPGLIGIPLQNPMQPIVPVTPRPTGGGGGRFAPAPPPQIPGDPGAVRVDASVFGGRFARGRDGGREGTFMVVPWEDVDILNAKHVVANYPRPEGGAALNYLPDAQGELGFVRTGGQGGQRWQRWDGSAWQPVTLDTAKFEVQGAGNAPGQLVVREIAHGEKPGALRLYDAVAGEPGDTLLADENYDFAGTLHRDAHTGLVVGVKAVKSGPANLWFDPGMASVQQLVDTAFKGKFAEIKGRSADGRVFLVATSSDRDPVSYFTVDLATKAVSLLKSTRPWLDAARLQRTSALKYRTGGHRIDAYVTLPAGASAENPAPLVVLGPEGANARVDNLFNPLAQYYASRGYAVLTLNHRGSAGYRWMSTPEVLGEPASIPADVVAATQTVLKTGLVDPRRVVAFGEGFAGWATLEAAALAPDLFKAVAVHRATYNWETPGGGFGGGFRAGGFGRIADPAAISPINHTSQLRSAVFVAVAASDRGNFAGTQTYINALKSANVAHDTFVVDHPLKTLDEVESRAEMFARIEAFFRARL